MRAGIKQSSFFPGHNIQSEKVYILNCMSYKKHAESTDDTWQMNFINYLLRYSEIILFIMMQKMNMLWSCWSCGNNSWPQY